MQPMSEQLSVRYIDLFSGMGGFRDGFERAYRKMNIEPICVFTSEIKTSAIKFYSDNFEQIEFEDITQKKESEIPNFSSFNDFSKKQT